MLTLTLMDPSKETDNKLRWSADIDGVSFALYVPKWRVPEPWPQRIKVVIKELTSDSSASTLRSTRSKPGSEEAVTATLKHVGSYTRTVRYCPIGDKKEWELGQPYIPQALLSEPPPDYLSIHVQWERETGNWP